MLSGIGSPSSVPGAMPLSTQPALVSPLALPTLTADRLTLQQTKPPLPDPTLPPYDPPTGETWKQKLRVAATFAVPTAVGAGLGLGIAAATGASLGVGALIGAGVGLAAVVGVLVLALRKFT